MLTEVTFVVLAVAAALFAVRLTRGPSLADRLVGVNGLVVTGMGAIATHAAHTSIGSFLPTLVAVALVGPTGNAMIARFLESRER
jgi:multicomponent Na+:H+ antiporter subunit F